MLWGILALLSAFLLGVYDIFKKLSLKENAVIPVLFFSTLTSAVVFLIFFGITTFDFHQLVFTKSLINIDFKAHMLFMAKSIIVGSSWTLAYFAMKHLPITIVSPIRSSSPLWVLVGGIVIFGERLAMVQWLGVFITIFFYYLFSKTGLKEGIEFRKNKWVIFMTISTIIGAISSLFDKYLVTHYDRLIMQAWYHIYMVPLMLLFLLVLWYPKRNQSTKFEWRWSIPMIGICLAIADFIYFWALAIPGALVALVSTIRRGSVIVSFSIGARLFKEKNIRNKALALAGILLGIIIIILGASK